MSWYRGREAEVDEVYDGLIQEYIINFCLSGGIVNTSVVIVAAEGLQELLFVT